MFFYYLIAQPFYIQFLTRIFGEHIWAISYKKPTLRLEKEEKYLTIPKNFSGDDYYRFYKLNLIVQEIIKGNSLKSVVVVDIGSGNGYLMKYIKDNSPQDIHFEFIGIDKYVEEKSFDFKLINQDIEEKIDLPDQSADIIIGAEIIEHIANTDGFI